MFVIPVLTITPSGCSEVWPWWTTTEVSSGLLRPNSAPPVRSMWCTFLSMTRPVTSNSALGCTTCTRLVVSLSLTLALNNKENKYWLLSIKNKLISYERIYYFLSAKTQSLEKEGWKYSQIKKCEIKLDHNGEESQQLLNSTSLIVFLFR